VGGGDIVVGRGEGEVVGLVEGGVWVMLCWGV